MRSCLNAQSLARTWVQQLKRVFEFGVARMLMKRDQGDREHRRASSDQDNPRSSRAGRGHDPILQTLGSSNSGLNSRQPPPAGPSRAFHFSALDARLRGIGRLNFYTRTLNRQRLFCRAVVRFVESKLSNLDRLDVFR